MTKLPLKHALFWSVALVFLLYSALYIYKTTFVVGGVRYFSLFEDAMISLRYGRNLIQGFGLVYNPGEHPRVEGYTNFLWVVLLGLLQVLPLPEHLMCVTVQLLAVGFLTLNLWFVYRIAGLLSGNSPFVVLLALALTAFYLPLNTWSLQGMEVSLLTALFSGVCWLLLANPDRPERVLKRLFFWLGISLLVRPDMVLTFLVFWGYLWYAYPQQRREIVVLGLGTIALVEVPMTLFRVAYFGDVLPNTYYLKMTGFPTWRRVVRGLLVYLDFVEYLNLIVFVAPFLALLDRTLRKPAALLVAFFVFQSVYSIYVGGDAWEELGGANRYYCIAMPGFFILLALVVERLVRGIGAWTPVSPAAERLAQVVVGVSLVLMVNALKGKDSLRPFLKVRPLYIDLNEQIVKGSLLVRDITRPEASVAVVSAGAPGFYLHRTVLDILGKCDLTVAHLPMRPKPGLRGFHPGHMKWSYDYSIGKLQPDVVFQVWPRGGEEALPLLQRDYVTWKPEESGFLSPIFLRKNSPRIDWQRVGATQPVAATDIPVYKPTS